MTVKELIKVVIFDDVCFYHKTGADEFEDIYKGLNTQIPEELMDAEVLIVSARKKDLLDIQVAIKEETPEADGEC